jgi:23S rRNA pseudouridine1911/1915/1917 synthase
MNIDASPSKPTILPQIIFEDAEIIVLNKPAGLLVLPDRFDPSIPNLYGLLKSKYGQIYIVHRIDKETSGLIIFAKNETSHRALNEQFENRATEKTYRAICVGDSLHDEGRIDLALGEDRGKKGRMRIDQADGKNAVTNYKVLERFVGFNFIKARPETGRTHQIRVHLKAMNLPILCDSVYGGGQGFFLSQIKPGYRVKGEEKPLLNRTALHAARLSVLHPGTNQPVTFESELPKDMKIVLNYLRKFRRA